MGLAEGVEHSLGEGACIPPLDLAVPVRVYGAKFGSGDDHLMTERLQAAGDPLAFGRRLEKDPR